MHVKRVNDTGKRIKRTIQKRKKIEESRVEKLTRITKKGKKKKRPRQGQIKYRNINTF